MLIRKWDDLPAFMRVEAVRPYHAYLKDKPVSLLFKRGFDVVVSSMLIVLLSPVFLVVAIAIRADSEGDVIYRQERVTTYGRSFHIYKFRTMRTDADRAGPAITSGEDPRITRVGARLRKARLDELPQLLNVLRGDMTFVGTRPEVRRFVNAYTDEMMATLLLPAGITSLASLEFKDEASMLMQAEDAEATYIQAVLPLKMAINLKETETFSFFQDLRVMLQTVCTFLGIGAAKRQS